MFPSVLNTFNRPTPTDRLNSPSHSALHNTVSSALGQVQAVIGTNTGVSASAVGTLMYDVRSPDSNGGGHVQTAVKGGTGQTTFTKGDLLVATGPSVISKLAVSSVVNDVLIADPNQAAGMKWAPNPNSNKIAIITQTSSIYNTNTEEVLFAASILGSTLGTNNAIKFKGVMRYGQDTGDTFTVRAKYGNNTMFSIVMPQPTSDVISSTLSFIEGTIVGHSSVSTQKSFGELYGVVSGNEIQGDLTVGYTKFGGIAYGTSSVNSSADQNLIITGQFQTADVKSSILTQFFVVEKII